MFAHQLPFHNVSSVTSAVKTTEEIHKLKIVDSKTIPVYHAQWGINTYHKDEPVINQRTGILWYDKTTMEELMDMIELLSSNQSLYNNELNMAYEFLKDYNNPKVNFGNIIDKVLNCKIDNNKDICCGIKLDNCFQNNINWKECSKCGKIFNGKNIPFDVED